ncbi:hypothetical protein A2U01_0033768, partial [Trifolium medium]|nr:hypothetical protein [Trifolium medium]
TGKGWRRLEGGTWWWKVRQRRSEEEWGVERGRKEGWVEGWWMEECGKCTPVIIITTSIITLMNWF